MKEGIFSRDLAITLSVSEKFEFVFRPLENPESLLIEGSLRNPGPPMTQDSPATGRQRGEPRSCADGGRGNAQFSVGVWIWAFCEATLSGGLSDPQSPRRLSGGSAPRPLPRRQVTVYLLVSCNSCCKSRTTPTTPPLVT